MRVGEREQSFEYNTNNEFDPSLFPGKFRENSLFVYIVTELCPY